jgi:hypothetical protein
MRDREEKEEDDADRLSHSEREGHCHRESERLKHWLQQIDMQGRKAAEHRIHSLQAGSVTDAAKARIEERGINWKGYGNWKTDAVTQRLLQYFVNDIQQLADPEARREVGERTGEWKEGEGEE